MLTQQHSCENFKSRNLTTLSVAKYYSVPPTEEIIIMEYWYNTRRKETPVLIENPSLCNIIHEHFFLYWPGNELGPLFPLNRTALPVLSHPCSEYYDSSFWLSSCSLQVLALWISRRNPQSAFASRRTKIWLSMLLPHSSAPHLLVLRFQQILSDIKYLVISMTVCIIKILNPRLSDNLLSFSLPYITTNFLRDFCTSKTSESVWPSCASGALIYVSGSLT